MDAELQEDRLAVLRGRVLGDLDAVDVAALDRTVVERELLDQPRVAHREALELEVVVGEAPVLVRAAGELGLGVRRGELLVGRLVGLRARLEVGDAHGEREAGVTQLALVGGAVQHDLDGVGVAVLGQVEAQGLQVLLVLARARGDIDDLHLAGRALRDRDEADREVGARCAATEAAGLDAQLLALLDEALGQLVGAEAGRAGDLAPGARVEDAEIPVALARQAGADQAGCGRCGDDSLRARCTTGIACVARAIDGRGSRDLLRDGALRGRSSDRAAAHTSAQVRRTLVDPLTLSLSSEMLRAAGPPPRSPGCARPYSHPVVRGGQSR